MYPNHSNDEEGNALDALNHPHGEDYPGEHDWARKKLIDLGWNEREISKKYGKRRKYNYP